MKSLILGVGNILLGDEGVGVIAARELETAGPPAGADVVDGGTGGFHLLSFFHDYEHIVLIDAAADGRPPGTVSHLKPRFAKDFPRSLSAHDIGLRDLIEAASLVKGLPRLDLITVSVVPSQPLGLNLSEPVRSSIPEVICLVHSLFGEMHRKETRAKKDYPEN